MIKMLIAFSILLCACETKCKPGEKIKDAVSNYTYECRQVRSEIDGRYIFKFVPILDTTK